MVNFRITNALLGVLAAVWWFLNRQSDMAEPIVGIIACSILAIEIIGEAVAAKSKAYRESQTSLESKFLPKVLDRIDREKSNIQQVIEGKRKKTWSSKSFPLNYLSHMYLNSSK